MPGSPSVTLTNSAPLASVPTSFQPWSGRPADGRIVGPDVAGVNDLVLVTFAVRPLGGDFQTCPSSPASRVTADLGEPLGTRTLLDGGALPPREPVEP